MLARSSSLLALLMLLAYVLRLLLIVNGGQLFHPDELRYYRSIEATKHIFNSDIKNAVKTLLKYEFHQGIALAKLLPAMFHRFIYSLNHDGNLLWKDLWQTPPQHFRLPALIFALPSALCIGMVYLIQRQAGAAEGEALLSAYLLATAHSFFYFAKHLLPYDIAMLIGLVAIYFALRLRVWRMRNALLVGWLAFLVFWIYNGYIAFTLTIGILYCGFLAQGARDALRRALGMAGGALLFFLPIALFNRIILDENVLLQMLTFSETINHGAFSEGAIFPLRYFRDVEGAMALVWLGGLVLAAWRLRSPAVRLINRVAQATSRLDILPERGRSFRCRWAVERRRAWMWLLCLVGLYLLMSLLSTGMQLFVVYGRVARSMTPFIAMLCAFGLSAYLWRFGRGARALFLVGVGALALANFAPAIAQRYPLEIAWAVYQTYDDVSFETKVDAGENPVFTWWDLQPALPEARYRLFNAANYYPIRDIRDDLPAGEILLQVPHPFNYKPWQYEGMTPEMRDLVNRSEIKIWLVDTRSS